jgi:peptide/nickel transport system substrate-binding protein
MRQLLAVGLAAALLTACGTPAGSRDTSASGQSAAPTAPKRITAVTQTVPPFLFAGLNPSNVAGGAEVVGLINSGLTIVNDRGIRVPLLATDVPTIENGLWRVTEDGRMETTWRLKPGLEWHDGTPFTADDLVFTTSVHQDPAVPLSRTGWDLIASAEAADASMLLVRWRALYLAADEIFDAPMARHLLEESYRADPAAILDHPYFQLDIVGTGPFRVKEWERDSYIVLSAFDRYVLGRPTVDEVVVRFIPDGNTRVASLLAGEVDFTLGRGPSIEQAVSVAEQWRDGRAEYKAFDTWVLIYPQFVDPSPSLVADPQFRRALLHAIDRQQMVDELQFGKVLVAHSPVAPSQPEYATVESRETRYPYDPRRAAELIQGLGYSRNADGLYVDGVRPLTVQIQVTTALDIQPKSAFAVADFWKRLGVTTEIDIVPPQLAQDRQYRANFPAFALQRQGSGADQLANLRIFQARLAPQYTGNNNARYMNPEVDALAQRYLSTIPLQERAEIAAQITGIVTSQAVWLGLFFDTEPALIANRLINVGAKPHKSTQIWNAHEWDIAR